MVNFWLNWSVLYGSSVEHDVVIRKMRLLLDIRSGLFAMHEKESTRTRSERLEKWRARDESLVIDAEIAMYFNSIHKSQTLWLQASGGTWCWPNITINYTYLVSKEITIERIHFGWLTLSLCCYRNRQIVVGNSISVPNANANTTEGHTHKHTLALIAFIVALHCSVDVFKSQFYGFISPQWVRGFAHTRGYLNGSFEIVSVSVRICFRTLSTNRMPGKGTYSHWNWKRFRDLSD